jgi:steroid delta-isomerase-like uncharacterized protein
MASQEQRLSPDAAKEVVRRRFRELDAGNTAILDELFSPDYRLNFPGRAPMDLERTKRFYEELYSAFPDLRHEIVDQIAEGDRIVTRWTATGTHRGDLMGVAPSGQSVSFTGINIYRLEGDKLVESHVSWDMLGLLKQLDPSFRPPG